MSQSPIWWRTLVLSTIVLCIAFAVGASGQGGKQGNTFATVDMQKISADYKAKQAVEAELKTMQDKFNRQVDRRSQNPLLTVAEHTQLDDLMEKATPTDAEKKTIKDLLDKSAKLNEESQTLSQKADIDAAGKKRLEELSTQFNEAQARFNAMKEDMATQVRNFGQGKSDQLMKDIKVAVGKVAKAKDVAIVFDGQVALYAGVDLTDAVLADLNKGK